MTAPVLFDATGLPPLKPCPACGSRLEYWDSTFVACSSSICEFTREIAGP